MRVRTHLITLGVCLGGCLGGWASLAGCGSGPAGVEASFAEVDLRRCKPAPGTTGTPNTIEEAVALVNGLPFPVTAPCFVEALGRPLRGEATSSESSAQPAVGARSPRLFLWTTDAFVIAVTFDGPGRKLVEFGQFVTPRRSVKGEIEFPLLEPISSTAPVERVRNLQFPRITKCFVCHDKEEDEPLVPGGRSSLALRPHPSTIVDLGSLHTESEQCDADANPARCRLLHAVVAHGPVEHRPFDASLPVF